MSDLSPTLNTETDVSDNIILTTEHITQIYPGTVALDDVSFSVRKGKVNVLIGENGAGKSTLMKILAGVQSPTRGRILLDGNEIRPRSPLEANRLGIGMVFQELNLCDNLTVASNIFLARELTRRDGLISRRSQKSRSEELLNKLEQKIDPDELVGNLRIGSARSGKRLRLLLPGSGQLHRHQHASVRQRIRKRLASELQRCRRRVRRLGRSRVGAVHQR